jgi:hypothetical protein
MAINNQIRIKSPSVGCLVNLFFKPSISSPMFIVALSYNAYYFNAYAKHKSAYTMRSYFGIVVN